MSAKLLTEADLIGVLSPPRAVRTFLPRRKVVLVFDADTMAFDRGVRMTVRDDSDAGAAEAIVQMLSDYGTQVVECHQDGTPLTVSEALDASLKRDLARPTEETR